MLFVCGEVKRDWSLVYRVTAFETETQFTFGIFGERRKTFVVGKTQTWTCNVRVCDLTLCTVAMKFMILGLVVFTTE